MDFKVELFTFGCAKSQNLARLYFTKSQKSPQNHPVPLPKSQNFVVANNSNDKVRHVSHEFATQPGHSVDRAGLQAKMASTEVWTHDATGGICSSFGRMFRADYRACVLQFRTPPQNRSPLLFPRSSLSPLSSVPPLSSLSLFFLSTSTFFFTYEDTGFRNSILRQPAGQAGSAGSLLVLQNVTCTLGGFYSWRIRSTFFFWMRYGDSSCRRKLPVERT